MTKGEILCKLQDIPDDTTVIVFQETEYTPNWLSYFGDILDIKYVDFETQHEGIQKIVLLINDQYNE
jgi:hypothetical protein